MKFAKMHGCGNDYVFVDCITNPLMAEEYNDLARTAAIVSDRRTGIGADGLILIRESQIADFRMEMYNADGSTGEMCGNGIRCIGKYVYEHGLTKEKKLTIETKAGIKELMLNVQEDKVVSVRVNMGKPELLPEKIPVEYQGELKQLADYPLEAGGIEYLVTCVSMGNPHAVLFVADVMRTDVRYVGGMLEHHKFFSNRTNVEFVHIIDRQTIEMRVWERGSGETFACGTGSCASVIAGILHGKLDDSVTVHLLGGDLFIEYDRKADVVYMTGPTVMVYEGETRELLN